MINLKRKKKTLDDVIKNLKIDNFNKNYINDLYKRMRECYGMV